MEARCPKCGMWQDPTAPLCRHMKGRLCGILSSQPLPGRMSTSDRGKLGAKATGLTRDQLRALGARGGVALREARGYNYYAEIGRKGGLTKQRHKLEREAEALGVADLLGVKEKS